MDIAEIDEIQSFVEKKTNKQWLWRAIGHDTGEILTFTLGMLGYRLFVVDTSAFPLWYHPIFHGQMRCIHPLFGLRGASYRYNTDSKDRKETSHHSYSSQMVNVPVRDSGF